jgi:hypothetical protein
MRACVCAFLKFFGHARGNQNSFTFLLFLSFSFFSFFFFLFFCAGKKCSQLDKAVHGGVGHGLLACQAVDLLRGARCTVARIAWAHVPARAKKKGKKRKKKIAS